METQYTIAAPKIFQQKLEYDEVGRIVKQESKNASQGSWLEQGYEYDNVDRLVSWSVGSDTTEYSYDEVGNRQTTASAAGGTTYMYGAPSTDPNRLQESEVVSGPNKHQTQYGYNLNGSVVERKVYDQLAVPSPVLLSEDHFGYSYRELNWRYINGDPFSTNHSDWRYRYNAMGEREQKRLYHAPLSDSVAGSPYPWVQYILGGSKDQLAVWHGQQMTSLFCDTVKLRNVYLYPTEYITNGIGWNGVHEDITPIITRPDGSKEYRISDHLASLRVNLTNGSPTKYYDYDPWGNLLGVTTAPRRGFNDNEKDRENGLFSLGVRKYEEGRFISIDPLWELEPEVSPYVYTGNDPLRYVDPEGMQRKWDPTPKMGGGVPDILPPGGGSFGLGGRRPPPESSTGTRPSASASGGTNAASAQPSRARQSATTTANTQTAQSTSTVRANNANGKAQEAAFKLTNGGQNGVSIQTTQGKRIVDNVKGTQANEVKVGRTPYSSRIRSEVAKDAEILKNNLGKIQTITWHFYPSPVTGQGGPTLRLLNALQQHGIGVVIHP